MPLSYSFYLALASFAFGGLFNLIFARWRSVARAASLFWGVLGSGLLLYLSWQLFSVGTSLDFQLFEGVTTITTALHIDIFTAFFFISLGVIGLGFFSFWSTAHQDHSPSVQALAHGSFLVLSLLLASSNVLFFVFLTQLFGLMGWFYLSLDKESTLQRKLMNRYIIGLEIGVMVLTIMWLLLASSAQNLYFGALVQAVAYLEDMMTVAVTGLLIVGMITFAICAKQLVKASSSYVSGMFSALMFILIGYLFLRVELFFVPAVSLWVNIGLVAVGLLLMLFLTIYAWINRTVITFWSLALPMVLTVGGLFFWALQGNIAAMVSIWGVALYWALISGVFNGALYFWTRHYQGLNQLRLGVLAISLFTTLWLTFQGLWQSIVLVSDPVWRMVMLVIFVTMVGIGILYALLLMKSSAPNLIALRWNQFAYWPLIVWTLLLVVLMLACGMLTELLANYTLAFLGLNGTLIQGTWTSYAVNIQGMANTVYIPFFLLLVVLFWLVASVLTSGKSKSVSTSNRP